MKTSRINTGSLLFLLILLATATGTIAAGPETKHRAPRNADGHPDLQGVWNYSSDVPLERSKEFADKKFFTREELEKQRAARETTLDTIAKLAPVEVADKIYLDYTARVENLRTSLVTYPDNGRLPKLVEGIQRIDPFAAILSGGDAQGTRPVRFGFGGIGKDGPEDRGLSERCISLADPPYVPGFDGNYVQIVQAADQVAFLTDIVRIVPLDGRPPLGERLRSWSGDSRGHWEGDTLVVETKNFNNLSQSFNSAGTAHDKVVTERFTRLSTGALEYEATIVDPKTFQDKIVLSVPMAKVDARIYESACHEGNYSMFNTLSGARKEEQEQAGRRSSGDTRIPPGTPVAP